MLDDPEADHPNRCTGLFYSLIKRAWVQQSGLCFLKSNEDRMHKKLSTDSSGARQRRPR
jgi:hypothetical protein